MSRAIPQRYVWAVEILDVQPDDTILEIGFGYGHSIPLISDKLTTGHLTAIDRSDKMVAAATEATRQYLASGNVTVLHTDLLGSDLEPRQFNKIFLYNLNVFWMDPRDELAEIRRLLKQDGRLYIFHQPPPEHEIEEFQCAFRQNLAEGNFEILDVLGNPEVRSTCIIARPNRR